MRKHIMYLAALAILAFAAPALAQPAMVLHPGDKILFQPGQFHKVLFGGDVLLSDGATPFTLTNFSHVAKLLEFFPCDATATSCNVLQLNAIVAVVRSDIDFASPDLVVAFDFSCGIHNEMVVQPFTVEPAATPAAPARTLTITANNNREWLLDGVSIMRP